MREIYNKYGALVILVILFYLGYIIVKPYILPILSSAVIAYMFYPIYKWLLTKIKRKNITAFLMCILVLLLLIIPLLIISKSLIDEIPGVYTFITSSVENSKTVNIFIEKVRDNFGTNINLDAILGSLTTALISYLRDILSTVPEKFVNLSVSAFFLFFFFRDGPQLMQKTIFYLPFNKKDILILFRQLKETVDAVLFGQLITAVIQAFLATMAYFVIGVNAPFFWGIMTFIFSIIPIFGPWFIYLPLSASIILTSLAVHDSFGVIKGVVLLGYGIGIVSTVDNVLKPFLISDKVRLHAGLIFIGVLGGLSAFGIIGVILGPLIIAILYSLFSIYEMKEEFNMHIEHKHK